MSENDTSCNLNFLFYLLSSLSLSKLNSDSAVPGLNRNTAYQQKILLPPFPEQKAIAEVLSSLDDKIDLLHRQNKTLESLSQALFRKWFIDNPEREKWEKVSLGDSELCKIIGSGIDQFEGEKKYLATGDVDGTNIKSGEIITYEERPSRANMQPIKFSVWFAKKGGVRKLLMFDDYSMNIDELILSTRFMGLKTTKVSHYYIWLYILSDEFQKIKNSSVSGTVQPDINNNGVRQIMISNPNRKLLLKFNSIVRPLFIKIQFNQSQIRTLENMRDTLLPKLMSGEVRVRF